MRMRTHAYKYEPQAPTHPATSTRTHAHMHACAHLMQFKMTAISPEAAGVHTSTNLLLTRDGLLVVWRVLHGLRHVYIHVCVIIHGLLSIGCRHPLAGPASRHTQVHDSTHRYGAAGGTLSFWLPIPCCQKELQPEKLRQNAK